MKTFRILSIITAFIVISLSCRAQYGTVRYWGKVYQLDRQFIGLLNENWNVFTMGDAHNLRYYDPQDYQAIYNQIVENLTSSTFVIIVTESNQLQWQNSIGVLPGTDGNKDESKKRHARASAVWYRVVLPALNQFVQYKDANIKNF